MNNKHLTFEERSIIEELLNKGEKIHKNDVVLKPWSLRKPEY